MAGEGSRFAKVGYTLPKPLIDVNGQPMIKRVIDNIKPMTTKNEFYPDEFIFLVRKEHLEKFSNLKEKLVEYCDGNATIVQVDGLTEGAACTALLAKEHINFGDEDLLIVNSDQIIEYEPINFKTIKNYSLIDGIIFTFKATESKWSFAKTNDRNIVVEVAEKKPISDNATSGHYYWKTGKDFVVCAEEMIKENIRTNNEFYIAPVYNQLIKKGSSRRVVTFSVNKMWGIGTPEDLNYYLENNK